ncbi:MAG: phosphomannomutase/phosphoglucomutase [Candidatus Nealsonbacteria bacterium]|nr:phosphomannomutase/phosphoglucomutase [Candidatus Nealsonbacteria bacterium]
MKINPYIFRGYDIRGEVDKDLTEENVEYIGRAFGAYLKRRGIKKTVVGRDCRLSSPAYSRAIIGGLTWAGLDVVDIGMELVGTFYWSQYYLNCRGGVYITASHNPAKYNGFKLANDFSETLVSEGIQELRAMIEKEDHEKGHAPGQVKEQSVRQAYFDDLLQRVAFQKDFKIVVDAGFATAGVIAPALLRKTGAEVIEHNCAVDPLFPLGAPDPISMEMAQRLSKKVMSEKADIGFSYDSDGDRIGIVDDNGRIIWNDVLLALFAIDVLDEHPGATIMYNTLCSKVVEETIIKYGGRPFMWRVGHSFLKKKNQEIKAAFIGELSGHFFFSADFYNHDDGLYSTLRLLKYLAKSEQSLSSAIDDLPKYISSPEIKIYCADDKKVALIKKIVPVLNKDFPEAEVIDDERAGDGVRLNLDKAMFVIRYSQNAPYLTIKFEAKTQQDYDYLRQYISKLLHGYKEIDWQSEINVNLQSLELE